MKLNQEARLELINAYLFDLHEKIEKIDKNLMQQNKLVLSDLHTAYERFDLFKENAVTRHAQLDLEARTELLDNLQFVSRSHTRIFEVATDIQKCIKLAIIGGFVLFLINLLFLSWIVTMSFK